MRRLPPLVLSSALLLNVAVVTAAQEQKPRQPASATAPATKHSGTIIVEHDEDGTSIVKLEPMTVEQNAAPQSQLLIMASFKQDKDARAAKYVNLVLLSRSPKCRFPAQTGMQLLFDEASLDLKFQTDASTTAKMTNTETVTIYAPKAEGVLWVQSQIEDNGECAESLAATVSPETLARLAASKSATVKIGTSAFKLTADVLAALHDLAGRMKQ